MTAKDKKSKRSWFHHETPVQNVLLDNPTISHYVKNFWKKVVNDISDKQHIYVLFRVEYAKEGLIKTISNKMLHLTKADRDWFIKYVIASADSREDWYKNTEVSKIIFSVGIRDGVIEPKGSDYSVYSTDTQEKTRKAVATERQNYKHFGLPITMDPFKYGIVKHSPAENEFYVGITDKTDGVITVTKKNGITTNHVKYFRENDLVFDWEDTAEEGAEHNTFTRKIGKREFVFEKGELIYKKIVTNYKKISTVPQSAKNQEKFLTLDIETKITTQGVLQGELTPILVSIFDGKSTASFTISDYKDSNKMLAAAITSIMRPKYNNHKVYVHNLARFDGIFLTKKLSEMGSTKPIINKERLIEIRFKMKGVTITFKDSYQLLPSSLDKLTKSFNVPGKLKFPMSLLTQETPFDLDYAGPVPDAKYWDCIEDYNQAVENTLISNKGIWNFRNELIAYCEQDCIALFEVVKAFNKIIFDKFSITIAKFPTISSLAYGIFRAKFMQRDSISNIIALETREDIQKSYTGGSVDMYIPKGENIYVYDFNSLYPSVMAENTMPVSSPIHFSWGDIRELHPDAQGIFFCEITAPDDSKYHPALQTKVRINGTYRTVAGTGTWHDWINSQEMDFARDNFGYTYKIIEGYVFDYENIFKEYINTLYKIRLEYPKSHPMNLVAKFLMNSLYGRFGMQPSFTKTEFFSYKEYDKIEPVIANNIIDVVDLDNGKYMVTHNLQKAELEAALGDFSRHSNVNVAVSSYIAALGRIRLNKLLKYLVDNNYKLYYKDTDCVHIDKPLPDDMVSDTELGKLKLEYVAEKAIYLGPKLYYAITTEGRHICKVKGLSDISNLTYQDFEALLVKNTEVVPKQAKWFRNLTEGKITIKEQFYTIKPTDNKRELVYDDNNKIVGTRPYQINPKKTINTNSYSNKKQK